MVRTLQRHLSFLACLFALLSCSVFSAITVDVFADADGVTNKAAQIFIDEVKKAQGKDYQLVFVVPTGSTPIPFYQRIVSRFNGGGLDLSNVIIFNMDEYVGLG